MGYKLIDAGESTQVAGSGADAEDFDSKYDGQDFQLTRMFDILDSCEKLLEHVKELLKVYTDNKDSFPKDFEGIPKRFEKDPIRYLDHTVWKIEVDIENVEDISKRISADGQQTIREQLKSFLPSIF
jgi:hypothetical protein